MKFYTTRWASLDGGRQEARNDKNYPGIISSVHKYKVKVDIQNHWIEFDTKGLRLTDRI